MMIMDYSQIAISSVMVEANNGEEFSEDLLRHIILNTIRNIRNKFSNEHNELVIACDGPNYWRKEAFPYYKASRKDARNKSGLDWKKLFDSISTIREEIKENFRYKVIRIDGAEADDIIAALCKEYGTIIGSGKEDILILSGDKDFGQLHKYSNVSQYDPIRSKKIKVDNPTDFLHDHIIRGDRSDGIPNILSDSDTFVTDKRQKVLTKKRYQEIYQKISDVSFDDDTILENYHRNKKLIDLEERPQYIDIAVKKEYDLQVNKNSNLINYFMDKKLRNLMEHIGEF